MTDVSDLREAAILPDGLREGEGHFIPFLLRRIPIHPASFDARSVDSALANVFDALRLPNVPNLLTIAKLLGLAYFVGDVGTASDALFPHQLGRVPVLIVFSVDVNGTGGSVTGRPEAGGPNSARWSTTSISVRATVSSRYAFFVI